ncbi:MAG: hypothetical protein Q9168_003223 [Polycauliona sp. 1 TL-2023]
MPPAKRKGKATPAMHQRAVNKYIPYAATTPSSPPKTPISPQESKRLHELRVCASAISLMYKKCPQEIVDLIQDWLCEMLFCPGYVYLRGKNKREIPGWPSTSPGRPTLLSLSRKIFEKYQKRLWTDNTYIFDFGDTMYFRRIPLKARSYIRKIEFAFTIRDIAQDRAAEPVASIGQPYPDFFARWTNVPMPRLAAIVCDEIPNEHACWGNTYYRPTLSGTCPQCDTLKLASRWVTKWIYFNGPNMKITDLTLDFTECYDARGRWMGNVVADDIGHYYGRKSSPGKAPDRLEVLAPDVQKKEEILARIKR